jgi:hypothetical protein
VAARDALLKAAVKKGSDETKIRASFSNLWPEQE